MGRKNFSYLKRITELLIFFSALGLVLRLIYGGFRFRLLFLTISIHSLGRPVGILILLILFRIGLRLEEELLPWAKSEPALRPRWSLGLLIFLSFFCLYMLTWGGNNYVYDGEIMFRVTESLVERGDLTIRDDLKPYNNEPYCRCGLGYSLAAIPLYLFGTHISEGPGRSDPGWLRGHVRSLLRGLLAVEPPSRETAGRMMVALLNPLATALAMAVLYFLSLQLGYTRPRSLYVTIASGLGTYAWVYTKFTYSEPLAMLFLILSVFSAAAAVRERDPFKWALLSGLFAGLLILTRPASAVAVPWILLYVLFARFDFRAIRAHWKRWVADASFFLLGFLPLLLLHFWYNALRYGVLNVSSYPGMGYTTPFLVGLYGLLFSSGRGMFIFAPITALGLLAFGRFYDRHRAEALLFGGVFISHLVLYAKWEAWDAGGSWGARFLLPVIPLTVLPVAELFDGKRTKARRIALAVVLFGSILLQGLAVSADYTQYQRTVRRSYHSPYKQWALFWVPETNPWLGQWTMIRARQFDFHFLKIDDHSRLPGITPGGIFFLAGFLLGTAPLVTLSLRGRDQQR
jgi:hypothetical protein